MLCQSCGARNPEDEEYCLRCSQKLLVVSGPMQVGSDDDLEEDGDESFSFDEHLLERISVLEQKLAGVGVLARVPVEGRVEQPYAHDCREQYCEQARH